MNRIIKCFISRRCKLSKLYLCKIFERKPNGKQIGIKILYELNSIENNCFYDPTSGEVYFTLHFANIAKDEYYCEVCDKLYSSVSGPHITDIYKKGYLTKKEIQELNEYILQVYSKIKEK